MPQTIAKSESWRMFDDISPRYDFLNHFLSFGLDIRWRKRLARYLPQKPNLKVLDLATGTADVLLSFFKFRSNVTEGAGIDLADKMLAIGCQKVDAQGLKSKIQLQHGDANHIPFEDGRFDAVSIAFGIRNMDDPLIVLKEMNRALNSQGRALVLEFSLPQNPIWRGLHLFYLRTVVPFIGWIFSGNYHAYRYLNVTIEDFPYGENFCRLMREAGFKNTQAHPLLGGIATIYQGEKIA